MEILVAFYVGVWVGGLAALWSVARAYGWKFCWRPALFWGLALKSALEEADA